MKRFWEIDLFRGIAVILMIIFNYSFAIKYLNLYPFGNNFLYWYVFPRFIGGTFIFLAGLSLTLYYNQKKNNSRRGIYKKLSFRGLKIFGYGILITVITFLAFPQAFVVFGILHFIGFSMIFGQFFLRFKRLNLFLGLLLIALGLYIQSFTIDCSCLLWLGFIPKNFFTFDYFPILPWFGVTLLGIFFGNILYKNGKRRFEIKDFSSNFLVKSLDILGRNSLIIYLLHQPVLIMILLILGFRIF